MRNTDSVDISEKAKVILLDFPLFDDAIRSGVDEHLVGICEGDSGSDLEDVKNRFLHFLEDKTDKTSYGAVSEFFLHLILRKLGFKQDCMFFNLEENSIKKGFDGVYTLSSELYLMESKSTLLNTKVKSHKSNINLAYKDLSSYIDGSSTKGKNNPWRNAVGHASQIDVGSSKPLRDKLKLIANLYDKKTFQKVSEYNLVPCSTIYSSIDGLLSFNVEVRQDLGFISNLEAKTITAICVSNAMYDQFIEYLGGINGQ